MKLIVHIGDGKTGSSSVQSTLNNNESTLQKKGYFYLGLNCEFSPIKQFPWQRAAGWPLLKSLKENEAIDQMLNLLTSTLSRMEKDGYSALILSNESLLTNPDICIPVLQELQKKGIDVEIIAYFRRHDSWIRSAYLQWGIKHKTYKGEVVPFNEWVKNTVAFSHVIQQWISLTWAKINVVNFEECGDVVASFLDCCDLPVEEFNITNTNETPSALALNLWALYNSSVERQVLPNELEVFLNQTNILNTPVRNLNLSKLFPSQEDLQEILKSSNEDINRMNAIFKQHNQPPFDDKVTKEKDYHINTDAILSVFMRLFKIQQDKISSLEDKIVQIEQFVEEQKSR